jgi:hypothetical protein
LAGGEAAISRADHKKPTTAGAEPVRARGLEETRQAST